MDDPRKNISPITRGILSVLIVGGLLGTIWTLIFHDITLSDKEVGILGVLITGLASRVKQVISFYFFGDENGGGP